jgi:ATP-dependent helicase/nuclease subunit B
MAAGVTVVAGPARSGKTQRLLDRYRTALAGDAPGRNLWIAPSYRSAAEIRDQLLNDSLRGCFAPGVFTFEQFADAVLQAADAEFRPLGTAMKRRLIRRLIDTQRNAGKLRHFASIAGTGGLVDLVCQWIGELKRLEVWPDDFGRACHDRGETNKDRELLAIYRSYQEILERHQLYDLEGRFWSARRLLRDGQQRPFQRLELVVVDGFTDFTTTQHEILEILAARVEQLWISLPLVEQPARQDLFAKTSTTLFLLKQRHGQVDVQWTERSADGFPTLTHIQQNIFLSPHQVQSPQRVEGVEIVAAAQQLGEIEVVARRIKRLIVEDGVPPQEIAVVFRSPADVAPLVHEVFGQLGVPVAVEASASLATAAVMKALMLLVQLHVRDWPFRGLLNLLSHNYFQPDWPEWAAGKAAAAAEQVVRYLQVPVGRAALLAGTGRLAAVRADGPPGEASSAMTIADHAGIAQPLFERIATLLDALPNRAPLSGWAKALEQLADTAGIVRAMESPAASPSQTAADRAAWARLLAAVRGDDRMADWVRGKPPILTAAAAADALADILQEETIPAAHDETGRVRVLSASSARALRIPNLFVAGLAEKAFPSPDREDRLYGEAECQTLIGAGLPLVDRPQRQRDEMLLFYEVLTRGDRQLTLSYPAFDAAAQPLCPSPFLTEVERSCGTTRIPRTEVPDLSPVPRSPTPLSPTDWRLQAVAQVAERKPNLLAGLLQGGTTAAWADNLMAGLHVVSDRQRGEGFGPFEGLLPGAAAQEQLAARYGPKVLWSPSRLEQYATCPFRFFAEDLLQLEPVDELTLQIDYLRRGQLLHAALASAHRHINQQAGAPVSPNDQDRNELFRESFRKTVAEMIAHPTLGVGYEAALREIDRRVLNRWLDGYLAQHITYDDLWEKDKAWDSPPRPAHFEVRFGPARRTAEAPEDGLSIDAPLQLKADDETIRIVGRIDRIDVGRHAGKAVFNVIDYKSGSVAGDDLQLPLYVMAAEQIMCPSGSMAAWQAAYWIVRDRGYLKRSALTISQAKGGRVVATPDWAIRSGEVAQQVKTITSGVRHGDFPMFSQDDTCTSRCPLSTVCRVNQTRALGKAWPAEREDRN